MMLSKYILSTSTPSSLYEAFATLYVVGFICT